MEKQVIEQAGPVCREWRSDAQSGGLIGSGHECGKPAVVRVVIESGYLEPKRRYTTVYKCERHARRFRGDPRFVIKELT